MGKSAPDGAKSPASWAQTDALLRAFRHLERRRYPRTAGITRQSRWYGWVAQWERPWATRLREGLFRATAPLSAHALRRLTTYEV